MGRAITARKLGKEKCLGSVDEARVNERGMKVDTPCVGTSWKAKFQLLGKCPLEPGEVIPTVKSQELEGMAYQIEGRYVRGVQEPS